MDKEANLSNQEVNDLVASILEGIDAIEEGHEIRATWADEMRDWCLVLLSRKEGGA